MSGPTNNTRVLRNRKNDGTAVTAQDLAQAGAAPGIAEGPRTYSDVVASRPSTPEAIKAKEEMSSISQVGANIASNRVVPEVTIESQMSKLTSLPPSDEYDPSEWTTVTRRRRASLPSLRGPRASSPKIIFEAPLRKPDLTVEQQTTVQAAEARLTEEQRQRIHKRDVELAKAHLDIMDESSSGSTGPPAGYAESSTPTSRGEGPSGKGKGPDVRNWGAAGISLEDVDIEAQREEFELWKAFKAFQDRESHIEIAPSQRKTSVKDWIDKTSQVAEAPLPKPESELQASASVDSVQKPGKSKSKSKNLTADHVRLERPITPAITREEVKPSKTNVKRSATPYSTTMKQAVNNAVKAAEGVSRTRSKRAKVDKPQPAKAARPVTQLAPNGYIHRALDAAGGPPSDSSSSGSSSSSESLDSESSSESSSSSGSNRTRRRRRTKKSRKNRSAKKEINPKEPTEYLGVADGRLFYRFVTEGSHYVQQGNIRAKRQVFVLSYFLKGKAYDFFTQEVSMDAASWNLRRFFEALFNYCFPLDYRLEQKAKLKRCYQNSLTVADYVHQLGELYNSIGDVNEQDMVDKLWTGFRPYIQRGLWMKDLSPETSTWADVKYQAEVIERIETMEIGGKNSKGERTGGTDNGGNNGKGKSGGFKKKGPFNGNNSNGTSGPTNTNNDGKSQPNGKNNSNQNGNKGQKGSGPTNPVQNGNKPKGPGNSKPPLTDQKKAELKAAGLCFNCSLSGHTQNNCPSKKKNGMRSNKAGFALNGSSSYQHVDGATTTIETMSLGAIRFDLLEERNADATGCTCQPHDYHGCTQEMTRDEVIQVNWDGMINTLRKYPFRQIGDVVVHGIETVLTLGMPYPGDPELHDFEREETRFVVYATSDTEYVIVDGSRDSQITVDAELLRDPQFELPGWYAAQMAELTGEAAAWTWDRPEIIGDAVALGLQTILESGISENTESGGDGLQEQFLVAPDESEEFGAEFYAIWDHQNNWCARIAITDLKNPKFDVINWYRKYCARRLLPAPEDPGETTEFLEWSVPVAANDTRVGDIYAEGLHRAFNNFPSDYPGDGDWLGWYDGTDRFEIRRISETEYGVIDHYRGFAERISFETVRNEFWGPGDVPLHRWYADLCADRAGLDKPPATTDYTGYETLFEDQLLKITRELLDAPGIVYYGDPADRAGILYGERFVAWGTDVWDVCSIVDLLRCAEFKLRREELENPYFDVRAWLSRKYEKRESRYGCFFDGHDLPQPPPCEGDPYYDMGHHPGCLAYYPSDFDPDEESEAGSESDDDMPGLHYASDSESESEGSDEDLPGLETASDTDSEFDGEGDMPDLDSVSDSDSESDSGDSDDEGTGSHRLVFGSATKRVQPAG
ncbi:hypothetical protein B0H11DRAFT_1904622 [Mycena galericulata]|nr:hypothetical protein B0H11DRAFT_1904622 [Mycena galericulata]